MLTVLQLNSAIHTNPTREGHMFKFYIMTTIGNSIELHDLTQPFKPHLQSPNETTCDSPDELMHHEDDHVNRPSVRGPYRPIRNGTIRGSVFAMLTSALGPGCLSLPYRAGRLGLVMFVVLTMACAALSYLGMYFMERIIVRYKVPSYSEMVRKAFGEKITKLAEVVLITYPLAITISVQVIFSKFITQLLTDIFGLPLYQNRELEIYNGAGNVVRIIVSLLHVAANYKNFFQGDLREMLHSLGKFSVTGVVFCLVCILITALTGFTKMVNGEPLEYKSILTMDSSKVEYLEPISGMLLLQSISGIFYTFLNPQFVFPLISHLKKPTSKRVDRIFLYSHYELLLIYLGIGILGYLLLSQHLDVVPIASLIVISIPTPPLLLGKLMLAIAMFFLFPLQVFTAREMSHEAFDIERNPENLKKINWIMVGSTCFVSIIFQQVTMYFGFIGGTMGVMMAVLIPALCMRKLIVLSPNDTVLFWVSLVMSVFLFIGAVESLIST